MGELTAQKSMLAGALAGKTGARSRCSRLSVDCGVCVHRRCHLSCFKLDGNQFERVVSAKKYGRAKKLRKAKKRGCERSELPSYVFFDGILILHFLIFAISIFQFLF